MLLIPRSLRTRQVVVVSTELPSQLNFAASNWIPSASSNCCNTSDSLKLPITVPSFGSTL